VNFFIETSENIPSSTPTELGAGEDGEDEDHLGGEKSVRKVQKGLLQDGAVACTACGWSRL